MRKQGLISLSPLFEWRVTPAESLGEAHRNSAKFEGVSGDEYALYWACRGPTPLPVRDVAAAAGLRSERLHKNCARVQLRLDMNILRQQPEWAHSLVPYAIGLRTHGDKLTLAEEYLRSLAKTLPKLSLDEASRAELLGWTLEHLGGVLLHRDRRAEARDVYQQGEVQFSKVVKSSNNSDDRGRCKHRAVACALGTANAITNLGEHEEALEMTRVLVAELRALDNRALISSRRFEFRGHRFSASVGEVERLRGVVAAKLNDFSTAKSALDESVGIMEETTTETNSPNQRVASYLKRAQSLVDNPAAALADLGVAAALIDSNEETGVYRVFIDKVRAEIFHQMRELTLVLEHAKRALPSARRLGLYRQARRLSALIYSVRMSGG